jgi:hypothetical protein
MTRGRRKELQTSLTHSVQLEQLDVCRDVMSIDGFIYVYVQHGLAMERQGLPLSIAFRNPRAAPDE